MAESPRPRVTPAEVKADTQDATPETDMPLAEKIETGKFSEEDADERGWIVHRETPDEKGVRKEHRIPVQYWPRYERHHNL